ncbi:MULTISPECIES: c-type cytochrome [Pusillimonas]|uniref:C-type cytochrome n=1 Tax=Pusillimonas minor TaxID=2697024 RepID=A0A842HRN5_9BURK|nr:MULTISPECIES: c-type cytochrome [Pusillimonas]MBC2770967.1 c-type cytochrome [Pusillimonas minor]MDX3893469.1 c-type cytochrome [Pusillimonas sp.]
MQGRVIYANNCAACHDESLQGQPNWRERMPNADYPHRRKLLRNGRTKLRLACR